jgi:hypothetical protein
MSQKKKQVRAAFRDACYRRDKYRCVMCGFQSCPEKAEDELDAHHVTDRNLLPNGGYVPENGISLCATCHGLAEQYHSTGTAAPGYSPAELYARIGSNYELAFEASERLSDQS